MAGMAQLDPATTANTAVVHARRVPLPPTPPTAPRPHGRGASGRPPRRSSTCPHRSSRRARRIPCALALLTVVHVCSVRAEPSKTSPFLRSIAPTAAGCARRPCQATTFTPASRRARNTTGPDHRKKRLHFVRRQHRHAERRIDPGAARDVGRFGPRNARERDRRRSRLSRQSTRAGATPPGGVSRKLTPTGA